jgi:dipeptidase D
MNVQTSIRLALMVSLALLLAACATPNMVGPAAVDAGESAIAATSAGAYSAGADEASAAAPSVDRVPLGVVLDDLQPRDVFTNFYEITQVPRPSGQMDQIQAFLVAFGEGLGLETIVDEAGNVIIRRPAAAGLENRPGVVLQAHMDMVAQKNDDKVFDFATDPIAAYVDGDYIVADGTTLGADDGIGMAMIMAVLQDETLQAGPIEGLFTVDEETTMSGINGLAAGVLQGKTLINLDSEAEGTFTIGSAGGERATVQFSYSQEPAPSDMAAYAVTVTGLKGGHSGVDINLGRGHATKILVRLLKEAAEPYGLRLAGVSSGTAGNAIPREAEALVYVPGPQVEPFRQFSEAFEAKVRAELQAVEPDLQVEVTEGTAPPQVMALVAQATLINALYATPQGVLRMSDAVLGLVETSTNIGITNVQDGQAEISCYLRSSVDSALEDTGQMIASVWELADNPAEFSDAYGGWAPDPNSPVLALMRDVYVDLYGHEPIVSAVHAGLECGVVATTYPEMDMISIGPTLENVHSPSERLTISSVARVMDLLTATLEQMP